MEPVILPSDMEIVASNEYCRLSCEYPASIDEYEAGFVYAELTWGVPVAMGPFSSLARDLIWHPIRGSQWPANEVA